ncbi:MAG: NAD+ synthase [Planctomycetes bacterium]|nr:NAD+ synthase [Planctomycetota bacterium]
MNRLDIQCELVEQLLVRFLRSEAGKFGFLRAVVGVSGGVDSAVTAALCARAYGPDNVLGVRLPYKTSSPASEADALAVVQQLGIRTRRIEISAMADGYLAPNEVADRIRRGNVMARARMIVLYDLSAEWRALVIGTSNKTEILLGYSTQFGDAACALNPLGDLYKHQIFQLARHLGLPASVIEKTPTADLFEGQTDEGELGFTYAQADALFERMIDQRCGEEQLVAEGFEREFVRRIAARVALNQYKRLPPVIAKLSERTVNHDFRYLRSWGH